MKVICDSLGIEYNFLRKQLQLDEQQKAHRSFNFTSALVCIFLLHTNFLFSSDYFQQRVEYTMTVQLDDELHKLSCFQSIVYTNNSPDELKEIYFHLWPNAYKDENTPLARSYYLDGLTNMLRVKKEDAGYIDSLNFMVNGEKVQWSLLEDSIDICKIELNKPVSPGQSITISTPFKVKIPAAKLSRLGHIDQSYFFTQWYPKPAVYDKNGWNYFSYLDKGEYYGEFGSFDVSITLPENYVVGATGELQNGEKEIHWLSEKALLTAKTDVFPTDMSFPASSSVLKTLRYYQENVHDFAWFTDKRWNVLKGEVKIPGEERTITTWAFFTNAEASLWKKVPEHLHDAIEYFSRWIGPYPYAHVTAVDVTRASGDGMEYPMITAIGSYGSKFRLEEVIVHEVAHNWFYGIVGNNERRHPWMDEGLTNFFETRYIYTKHKLDSANQEAPFGKIGKSESIFDIETMNHRDLQYFGYLTAARKNSDQMPDLSSEIFTRPNYPKCVYQKTTLSFDYLMCYLGDSIFDLCIKSYYEEWKYRHPGPLDMKSGFEKVSGKNLDWFFEGLIFSTKKIDYSISSIKKIENNFNLKIKNTKHIEAPISISSLKDGKILNTTWTEGFKGKKTVTLSCVDCDEFRIDAEERMPELYRDNNSIRTEGLLKRKEKLQMVFLAAKEDATRTQRFYSPIAGWNLYNGPMAGIALHNVFLPEKKFEYTLAPMYALKTQDIAGGGDLRYHLYPLSGFISRITLKTGFSHYAYGTTYYEDEAAEHPTVFYSKLDNRVVLQLREKAPRKQIHQQFTVRHIYINKDLIYSRGSEEYNYGQVEYLRENKNLLEKSEIKIQLTGSEDFYKLNLESKHFFHYNSTKKGFRLRFFAGYLHRFATNTTEQDYRLQTSGQSGEDDYLFDEVFLGRTESSGILSQQFLVADAGLKIPTLFYRQGEQWMFGLNTSTTLPGKLPFRLYAGLSTYNDAINTTLEFSAFSYELGVELPLIKDIFVIYFPLVWSNDMKTIIENEDLSYGNLIRWEFRLTKLNPLELIRKIEF